MAPGPILRPLRRQGQRGTRVLWHHHGWQWPTRQGHDVTPRRGLLGDERPQKKAAATTLPNKGRGEGRLRPQQQYSCILFAAGNILPHQAKQNRYTTPISSSSTTSSSIHPSPLLLPLPLWCSFPHPPYIFGVASAVVCNKQGRIARANEHRRQRTLTHTTKRLCEPSKAVPLDHFELR